MVDRFLFFGDFGDGPFQGRSEGFDRYCAAGLTDGLQPSQSPVLRTVLPQLEYEQAVRQHDQVHMPCLALAVAKLTTSHSQMLLAVPMKRLCACPATAITSHDASHFPSGAVSHQDLTSLGISAVVPQNDDPHFMVHLRDANGTSEVPLPRIASAKFLAARAWDRGGKLIEPHDLPLVLDLAVELQIPDVRPRLTIVVALGMYVVQVRRTGKIAVKREVPGDLALAHPVDQLPEQDAMILELFSGFLALLTLLKAAKLQRIMFTAAANVINEQVVMCDFVPLFGVIPEPTHVFDQLPIVVDQHVVDRDDSLVVVACGGILLQQVQASFVELLDIPIDFGKKAIPAGLVGCFRELGMHPVDGLLGCDHQPRQVFHAVSALRFARKTIRELGHGFLDHVGKINNRGHGRDLLTADEPCLINAIRAKKIHKQAMHLQALEDFRESTQYLALAN